MSLTIDRLPDPSIPEFVASLDDVGVAVTNDGKSYLNRSQSLVVGPSQFKAYESDLSFATRELESELTMFAWAYAVEAKYTKDVAGRIKALGIALHLGRQSERVSHIAESEKAKANKWFDDNNPFRALETQSRGTGA